MPEPVLRFQVGCCCAPATAGETCLIVHHDFSGPESSDLGCRPSYAAADAELLSIDPEYPEELLFCPEWEIDGASILTGVEHQGEEALHIPEGDSGITWASGHFIFDAIASEDPPPEWTPTPPWGKHLAARFAITEEFGGITLFHQDPRAALAGTHQDDEIFAAFQIRDDRAVIRIFDLQSFTDFDSPLFEVEQVLGEEEEFPLDEWYYAVFCVRDKTYFYAAFYGEGGNILNLSLAGILPRAHPGNRFGLRSLGTGDVYVDYFRASRTDQWDPRFSDSIQCATCAAPEGTAIASCCGDVHLQVPPDYLDLVYQPYVPSRVAITIEGVEVADDFDLTALPGPRAIYYHEDNGLPGGGDLDDVTEHPCPSGGECEKLNGTFVAELWINTDPAFDPHSLEASETGCVPTYITRQGLSQSTVESSEWGRDSFVESAFGPSTLTPECCFLSPIPPVCPWGTVEYFTINDDCIDNCDSGTQQGFSLAPPFGPYVGRRYSCWAYCYIGARIWKGIDPYPTTGTGPGSSYIAHVGGADIPDDKLWGFDLDTVSVNGLDPGLTLVSGSAGLTPNARAFVTDCLDAIGSPGSGPCHRARRMIDAWDGATFGMDLGCFECEHGFVGGSITQWKLPPLVSTFWFDSILLDGDGEDYDQCDAEERELDTAWNDGSPDAEGPCSFEISTATMIAIR